MKEDMIVVSDGLFPKNYKTGYRYCLMVGGDNKVKMVWNYNARSFMDIRDLSGKNVNGEYNVRQIKNMYKNGEIGFYFYEICQKTYIENENEYPF